MDFEQVMTQLQALSNVRLQRTYVNHGAKPPLFGVATGSMKPLAKKIGCNQPLAEQLYASGNYDAMYFAGIIADLSVMTPADFERWMDGAYFYMLSDFVVAVSLAETAFAQEVADGWIASGEELRMSAGWSCYQWLLGSRNDEEFDAAKLSGMLNTIVATIHKAPPRAKYAMNGFVIAVGVSFAPLHLAAMEAARAIGTVEVRRGNTLCATPIALESIQREADKGRLGFKRRHVRC